MALYVRPFTDEERATLTRLAYSRTAATRDVERARIIWLASQGERLLTCRRRPDLGITAGDPAAPRLPLRALHRHRRRRAGDARVLRNR